MTQSAPLEIQSGQKDYPNGADPEKEETHQIITRHQ